MRCTLNGVSSTSRNHKSGCAHPACAVGTEGGKGEMVEGVGGGSMGGGVSGGEDKDEGGDGSGKRRDDGEQSAELLPNAQSACRHRSRAKTRRSSMVERRTGQGGREQNGDDGEQRAMPLPNALGARRSRSRGTKRTRVIRLARITRPARGPAKALPGLLLRPLYSLSMSKRRRARRQAGADDAKDGQEGGGLSTEKLLEHCDNAGSGSLDVAKSDVGSGGGGGRRTAGPTRPVQWLAEWHWRVHRRAAPYSTERASWRCRRQRLSDSTQHMPEDIRLENRGGILKG
ncbi:hypothetical protein K438DRAFT_1935189 [Mycena galopus ATCC 62051]|nr:hypothetical protein K438DRAFT_1935189 [Mycena galopus ATCC 62051]